MRQRTGRAGAPAALALLCCLLVGAPLAQAQAPLPARVALPMILGAGAPTPEACGGVSGASYSTLSIASAPSDRPAAEHPDLNLTLRGWQPIHTALNLIEINGPADGNAPRLWSLFDDARLPAFSSAARVFDWNWPAGQRGALLSDPPVTLLGARVTPGEIIHTPAAGYAIGPGKVALVLYAAPERLTLKYTREDNVVRGYTVHLEGVCVEPRLLAAYQAADAAGRRVLPALSADQPVGRAAGDELRFAIRDSGSFLDPRSRKDWWTR